MPRNVEVKARIAGEQFELLGNQVAKLATDGPVELNQTDTFFQCNNGRLKLREFGDSTAELIFYQRADKTGPKTSNYVLSKCDPNSMLAALTGSNGVLGVVKKKRQLYFIAQTRVHLDTVEDLGTFLELEVVLGESQTEQSGQEIAKQILAKLNIADSCLISSAYLDLLGSKQGVAAGKHRR